MTDAHGEGERVARVRRLLDAAAAIHRDRARFTEPLVASTGLSPEGVELGFESLERVATGAELGALVAVAGSADHVHVVLSANVFVAPMRALALAWAAAPRVTVRPSPRDDVLARALVLAVDDPALSLVDERDVARVDADALHVYGSDETVAAVRARARPGVRVVTHGAGFGVAYVTGEASLAFAADALAVDVLAFDQRGCLSPRVAWVEGPPPRAHAFAEALHGSLDRLGARVPRGRLSSEEAAGGRAFADALAFAGHVWRGAGHVVGLGPPGALHTVPPAGRHALVVSTPSLTHATGALAPYARSLVALGTDRPERLRAPELALARVSLLGRMQRPPLDGPVDRRGAGA